MLHRSRLTTGSIVSVPIASGTALQNLNPVVIRAEVVPSSFWAPPSPPPCISTRSLGMSALCTWGAGKLGVAVEDEVSPSDWDLIDVPVVRKKELKKQFAGHVAHVARWPALEWSRRGGATLPAAANWAIACFSGREKTTSSEKPALSLARTHVFTLGLGAEEELLMEMATVGTFAVERSNAKRGLPVGHDGTVGFLSAAVAILAPKQVTGDGKVAGVLVGFL